MPLAKVSIHSSQFPDQLRQDLLKSLATRQVNHKFHYESVKQAQKWLALHETYSPSWTDPDCAAIYNRSFEAARDRLHSKCVHLIGLGSGGGQKDARLLELLGDSNKEAWYTPCDVSTAMVLTARQAALEFMDEENCFPLICDLATCEDLRPVLDQLPQHRTDRTSRNTQPASRLITFFGMLPNFEPQFFLPRLGALVQPDDWLLLSANLAPGPNYAAGVQRILPLYDNRLTREWLLTFLLDLGVERTDGDVRFRIEEVEGMQRVAAYFQFDNLREIKLDSQRFEFHRGDSIRLFFSYRHTLELVQSLLESLGLRIVSHWITKSGEEGVFLVSRFS